MCWAAVKPPAGLEEIGKTVEAVNLDELPEPLFLGEIHPVVHAEGADETNGGGNAERNTTGGDRGLVGGLFVGELHGIPQVFLGLQVAPVGGIVLGGLQQGTEVEDSLDEGARHMLLDDFPAQLDTVHAQEDIPGHELALPAVGLELDAVLGIRVDVKDDVPQCFDLGTADVFLREHLVADVVGFDDVEIPERELRHTATGEILGQRGANGTAPDDMESLGDAFGFEELVGLTQIHVLLPPL